MKSTPLTIESEAFATLRNDFNMILKQTLYNMMEKDGDKAELKVSLKITLDQVLSSDLERQVITPMFDHKVSSTLQYKTELDGFSNCEGYELTWDREQAEYVMKPLEGGLFDDDQD